jgi:hypothetical protein
VVSEEDAAKKEQEVKKKDAAEKSKNEAAVKPSLFGALKKSILNAAPSQLPHVQKATESVVSARGSTKGSSVEVKAGETTMLKFGPPYSLHVNKYSSPGQAHLQLQIQGSDGEEVSDMKVHGQRPDQPKFTITDSKGEIVQKGNFEYG